jgi:16S rRNA processing protein RimM
MTGELVGGSAAESAVESAVESVAESASQAAGQVIRGQSELVVMGRVIAPFGVKGWLKIRPFTEKPDGLLRHPTLWLGRNDSEWREVALHEASVNGEVVVAKLEGIDTPEAAAKWRHWDVAVTRSELPPHEAGEYYWVDLIGLEVMNVQGESLGRVDHLMDNGAQSVLVVAGDKERLIPFVDQYVQEVDVVGGKIRVDWGLDY